MLHPCTQCSSTFEVTEGDRDFYARVSPTLGGTRYAVPTPRYCPACRQQHRLAWRNEHHLFRRDCDLCKRSMVSVHPSNSPFPVYCLSCWWSDNWDPLAFGMELDLERPFLDQFAELQSRVPQLAIQNDNGIGSENSEYCYDISRGKNCYRVVGSWYIEECYYSLNVNRSKFLVDCNTVSVDCELVYESLDSQRLYRCAYMQNCEGSSDCFFGYDLKGCKDCVACFGLRHKRFHIFNQEYSEKEYRAKLAEFRLDTYSGVQKMRIAFDVWIRDKPRRGANIQNCEDSAGNNLFNCKSVFGYSVFNSEYSKFLDRCDGPKNCYDLINTGGAQWCYDCVTPDDSYMVLFSTWCWKSKFVLYSDNCHSSEHLLGCISLRRAKHCILNREYSEQEYNTLAGKIAASLEQAGEWGSLLPVRLSPFGYNQTGAAEYYPLQQAEAAQLGWNWSEQSPDTTGKETLKPEQIPDSISEIDGSVCNEILACVDCGRNYKIVAKEFSFYQSLPAPLPRSCPLCRHLKRFERKTPTNVWLRHCETCSKELTTSFPPDGGARVLCDECYFAEVY